MSRASQPDHASPVVGLPPAARWALDLLAHPWTPHLLVLLAQRPQRYRDLRTALPGMSTAVLTDRLKTLTDTGLAYRQLVNGDRGVHYEATDLGLTLATPLATLVAAAQHAAPDVGNP